MAREMLSKGLFFTFLLSLHIACSSGTLVGFSYDASEQRPTSWSPREIVGVLEKNKVSTSQFWVFVANPGASLDLPCNISVSINLFVNQFEATHLMKSTALATSWINSLLEGVLPRINVSSIIVTGNMQLHSVLSTLNLVQSALQNLNLNRSIKVSAIFSLSTLETLYKTQGKNLHRVMESIKETGSFIIVEAVVDGELSLADGFLHSALEKAISVCTLLPYSDIPIVLIVKSSVVPCGVEMADFAVKALNLIGKYPQIRSRISGLFAEISSVEESEQKCLSWEEKLIFPTSHRELLGQNNEPMSATRITRHDTIPPLTTPISIPSTIPTPGIITIPSTNPVTIPPTNPAMVPIMVPSTNPAATPITVPATNPMPTTPITDPTTSPIIMPPMLPITNPAIGPPAVPLNPPVTNPVTTYPIPPTGSMPLITPPATMPGTVPVSPPATMPGTVPVSPPATMPGTVPVSPTVSGQSWCVAKTGVSAADLQVALDYACGLGGADCSAIQITGSCDNPNTLQDHASYAFNNYFQKNPVPTSCDFGGSATIVSANPSSGTCIYPSSSSTSSLSPASNAVPGFGSTGAGTGYGSGSGSGSTVFNANSSAGSSTVFGSDNPTGSISNSVPLSADWTLLWFLFTTICITGKIW